MINPLNLQLIGGLKKTSIYTEGVLINKNTNKILCDTLEDTIRDINNNGKFDNEENKVYGKTAILSGVFDLEIVYSHSLKKDVVHLIGTPEFTYIYLHYGLSVSNTLGCILCGERVSKGKLKNTGMTDILVALLREHGGEGTIEILR